MGSISTILGGLLGALSGGHFDITTLRGSLAGGSGQQQPA